MTQQNEKTTFTQQELVNRPDGWTGGILAGVYQIDIELALFLYMGKNKWDSWRALHPEQLDEVVSQVGKRLADNLVIDANLDEYVHEALQEASALV